MNLIYDSTAIVVLYFHNTVCLILVSQLANPCDYSLTSSYRIARSNSFLLSHMKQNYILNISINYIDQVAYVKCDIQVRINPQKQSKPRYTQIFKVFLDIDIRIQSFSDSISHRCMSLHLYIILNVETICSSLRTFLVINYHLCVLRNRSTSTVPDHVNK